MPTPTEPSLSWSSQDKRPPHTNGRSNPEIQIIESCEGIIFEDDKKDAKSAHLLYGFPINAEEGVQLIVNLLKDFKKAGLNFDDSPWTKSANSIDDEKPCTPHRCKDLEKIVKLLIPSLGITFDRSVILKILSQPQCEGIRFYPCKKILPESKSENEQSENKCREFFSLVLVGVNNKGEDLLYKEKKETHSTTAVQPRSVVGEYGHPPAANSIVKRGKTHILLHKAIDRISGFLK